MNRRELARRAVAAALKVRTSADFAPWQPVPVIDLAQRLGIEVRFIDIPSMEGIYWKGARPIILIASERPPGRQAFTCGHELGHHVFGHGNRIDEAVEFATTRRSDEYVADVFASFLLMPKTAVLHAFQVRGYRPVSATPIQIFTIAGWLGVGYTTLVHHLHVGLRVLPDSCHRELLRVQPKQVKASIIGSNITGEVLVVDKHWTNGRSIDIQVGDYVLREQGVAIDGRCVEPADQRSGGLLLRGVRPAISRIIRDDAGWAAFVRVSRRHFVGRSIFRFLEEVNDD